MTSIMLIEDQAAIRIFVTKNLQARGYDIYEASTGAEGLDLMRKVRPKVLLLDFLLPDMNGDRLLAAMAAEPELKRIQVIIMTASINLGSHDYPNIVDRITKPLDITQLLEVIQRAVERQNTHPAV
jgi:two-component system, OmpR family, alkaline phosphatase synthesis response regulator PhoP